MTDEQIHRLAGQIVHQIRKRGPFLSLADFVNRSLDDEEGGLYSPRMMGALQAAIDNDATVLVDGESYGPTGINASMNQPMSVDGKSSGQRNVKALPNDKAVDDLSVHRGAPGYLTQADLLSMLGSFIAVRSDTFVVRAYGDWENPLTGEKSVAICEAVVQRFPDPLVPSKGMPWEPAEETRESFGRNFRITSFRWLKHDEI